MNQNQELIDLIKELAINPALPTTVNEIVLTAQAEGIPYGPGAGWTIGMCMTAVHTILLSVDKVRGLSFPAWYRGSAPLQVAWRDEELLDADNPRHPNHEKWRRFNQMPFFLCNCSPEGS